LQATGRDAKGRSQYRYHARFRAHQEDAKFELLGAFGHALPTLRQRIDRDLGRPGLPAEKVIAIVISLLEATFVRVGNEEYARANGSYGLTTLRDRHALLEGSKLRLRFKAKSARTHDVVVEDRRLARLVRRCQEPPGQILFQYVDADGHPHPIRSNDVNDYVRAVTGLPSTAKTFRTWGGTLLAAVALASVAPPTSSRRASESSRPCSPWSRASSTTPSRVPPQLCPSGRGRQLPPRPVAGPMARSVGARLASAERRRAPSRALPRSRTRHLRRRVNPNESA
jgi:DNA topoisomerase-1